MKSKNNLFYSKLLSNYRHFHYYYNNNKKNNGDNYKNNENIVSFAHLSDIHIWELSSNYNVSYFLKNNKWSDMKQIQGFLNLKYYRGPNTFKSNCFTSALQLIKNNNNFNSNQDCSTLTAPPPHLLLTGDLTNIALEEEFSCVRSILQREFLNDYQLFSNFNKNDNNTTNVTSTTSTVH
jgi:3',5'-cyclic AMP phosphodiesterase CpdA